MLFAYWFHKGTKFINVNFKAYFLDIPVSES